MKLYIFILTFFSLGMLHAQQQLTADKKSHTDAEGNLYWNREKPVYLRISDTPDGKGDLLKSKKSSAFVNPLYLDTEGLNYIRTRYAVDPETKKPIYPPQEVLWEIYADSETPQTSFLLDGAAVYKGKDHVYYGPNLSGTIRAKDKLSGVATSYVSVNEAAFSALSNELSFPKTGAYQVQYYSVDKVGNRESVNKYSFMVDVESPTTYYNINGFSEKKIIGKSTKIYLTREDNLVGVADTYYKFDNEEFKKYAGQEISFTYLEDGDHTLHFYSVDKVGNKEANQTLDFYFDKHAPIVAADVLGDRFIANDVIYFSGRTKLKLTSVDNKSGVKEVLYSVDNAEFATYKGPFYLPNVTGEHTIKYYSLDEMNNESMSNKNQQFKHNVNKVYVDLTGPSLSYSYIGSSFKTRDTLFIGPKTKIKLKGTDKESKLNYLSYSLDGAIDEINYESPFTIASPGLHSVEMFGYDNVNNRNLKSFELIVDSTAPEIITNFSSAPAIKEGVKVYPSFVMLYLAATDKEIGTDKIYYSINNGKQKLYTNVIQGFVSGKDYTLQVVALDKLGNKSEKEIKFTIE